MTLHSHSLVVTDAPERYAKQLGSHLGRKADTHEEDGGTRVVFSFGECLMTSSPGCLALAASAGDAESLRQVEDVVGRHLEKFGARAGLVVEWRPGHSTA